MDLFLQRVFDAISNGSTYALVAVALVIIGGIKRIGGVAGALAQHAESTLEKIGAQHLSVVREIFRNQITSEGTRAVLDVDEAQGLSLDPDELLSPWSDRKESRRYGNVPDAVDGIMVEHDVDGERIV